MINPTSNQDLADRLRTAAEWPRDEARIPDWRVLCTQAAAALSRNSSPVETSAPTSVFPSRWRSIADSMPLEGEHVLVWWPYWHTCAWVGTWDGHEWHSEHALSPEGDGPTHWMPLPNFPGTTEEPLPTDCSGDPKSCPDNEGTGCHCSRTVSAASCKRSHPHENMNAECQMLTLIARRSALARRSAVEPLVGPLLDAWDSVPNDLKGEIEEGATDLAEALDSIRDAMEGDDGE